MRKFILLIINCAVILFLTACNNGSASSTPPISQAHSIINYKKFSLTNNKVGSNQDTIIHSFGFNGSDGVHPQSSLIEDSHGNFYGTTESGGINNMGTVFKITPSKQEIILYAFSGADGANPIAGLIESNGIFYGTTYAGGANNKGVVFKITSSGVETVLHSFTGSDGKSPYASLIMGSDGNLYGTTGFGGAYGCGTVFKITSSGTESILHSFGSGSDGAYPTASLIIGSDGNFYGTTSYGGTNNTGTVFKITHSGAEIVLYSFNDSGMDGAYPGANLIEDRYGNFYGTTSSGGEYANGTVFKITSSGVESVLYSFGNIPDGHVPGGLIIDGNGNLYGTTYFGGANRYGTVFEITSSGSESVLYSFESGTDGSQPMASLIENGNGTFYSTTSMGGGKGNGTVFAITSIGVESTVYSFGSTSSDGATSYATLISDSYGNLYGTTKFGGVYGYGTVFEIEASGENAILYSFESGTDGAYPVANLVEDNNGNFYGTTKYGGAYGYGTVFEIESSGVESVIYSFAGGPNGGPDGAYPVAGLIEDNNGNFYGTTYFGGTYGYGTVFKITNSGGESVIHSFGAYPDGMRPTAGLVEDSNGNFYGTTYFGGQHRKGTVFEIESSGLETVLYSFSGVDGAYPYASLIIDGNGNLYGTTSLSGTYDAGTVFEIEPANNNQEIVLHSFSGVDGETPYASLIIDNNGNLYGTTYTGGANYFGTVFKIESSGVETVLYSFESGSDGAYPYAGLIENNGNFYGTTSAGGANGTGTVFMLFP